MKEGMKEQSGSEIQLHFFDEKKNCSFCFNVFFYFFALICCFMSKALSPF